MLHTLSRIWKKNIYLFATPIQVISNPRKIPESIKENIINFLQDHVLNIKKVNNLPDYFQILW